MSFGTLKQWTCAGLLVLVTALTLVAKPASAEEEGARKVKSKVSPIYPELAKRINLSGVVKVEVVIAPNGTVKSTKVIGGHPLLVEPAVDAVRKWRYEPAGGETTTTVEFHFSNN